MSNDGKDYEQFVALLPQALLNAESITLQKNIEVQLNKKIVDLYKESRCWWRLNVFPMTTGDNE